MPTVRRAGARRAATTTRRAAATGGDRDGERAGDRRDVGEGWRREDDVERESRDEHGEIGLSSGADRRRHRFANLDLLLGLGNAMYTAMEVLEGECRMEQALIRDKRWRTLALLPISKNRARYNVTKNNMNTLIKVLKEMEFQYIIAARRASMLDLSTPSRARIRLSS